MPSLRCECRTATNTFMKHGREALIFASPCGMDLDSDNEFEYPDIHKGNAVQPFMFEPQAPDHTGAADGPNS